MTQTVTNSGLGIQPTRTGTYGPKETAALGQGGESVYVNAANGNLIVRQSDGFLADIGFGLNMFQTYNSRGAHGRSWCFSVGSSLEFSGKANQEGSSIIRIGEDGHRTRFIWNAAKKIYTSEEGGSACVKWSAEGWVYQHGAAKTTCVYTQQGRLERIRDQDGHYITFKYGSGNQLTSIVDQSGKQEITWSFTKGVLSDVITTSEGQVVHKLHYEYDAHQRLHRVSRDLGNNKSYWVTYEYAGDTDLITEIKQSDGTQLHVVYDSEGRVRQLIDGEGRSTTYTYTQGATTVTNALDEAWTYFYDDKSRLTGIDGPEHYRVRYYYDGAELSTIVEGTHIWRFRYNDCGDCVYSEEPNGQITQRFYDAEHQLLCAMTYQDFDGEHHPIHPKTTRYVYDAHGHLLFQIQADGVVTEYRYTVDGLLASTRTWLHAVFDTATLGVLEPLGEEALRQWAGLQNPQDVQLIEYTYDWRGQLLEEVHYTGVTEQGEGIGAQAMRTNTVYDAAGRLLQERVYTEKGWSTTHYSYDDLGRLIQTIDNQGHYQRIEYDDALRRIIQTDANTLQTIRTYDRSGLLLSCQRLDAHHDFGSIRYQYDAAGRLIAETDAAGHSVFFFYDLAGRVCAKVNAYGQMTEYHYNQEGLLIQTHQYAQRVNTSTWLTQRPDFAAIKSSTHTNDNINHIIYNQYHQIAYSINAEGAVIGYTYDAQGNVVQKTAFATRLAHVHADYVLDFNDITIIPNKNDRTIRYYYDIQGRVQAEVNAEGYVTEYRYNALGLRTETIRYTKRPAALSGLWPNDRPQASPMSDVHTYTLYSAQGQKIADIDGEGYLIEYFYDAQGLLAQKLAYAKAVNPEYINDAMTLDILRPAQSTNDHRTVYTYDDLGQLIGERTQSGLIICYEYDEMGHLILKSKIDEKNHLLRQQRIRYDALGRIIQELDELGCAKLNTLNLSTEEINAIWAQYSIRYTYDAAGLVHTKTDSMGRTLRYFYNEYQQLQYTIADNGSVVETRYNAFNQIESVYKYSAFLKGAWRALTTDDLTQQVRVLRNEYLDEEVSYEYNSIGQIIAKNTGTKGQISYVYDAFGALEFSAERIDAHHKKTTAYTYDRRGLLKETSEDAQGINRTQSIEYDAFGWVIGRIDARHHAERYELNRRGEQNYIYNAFNYDKRRLYDAFGRVISESNFSRLELKKYFYNDEDNTFTVQLSENKARITTKFNAYGDKIEVVDAHENKTDFIYDERGLLLEVDTPENHVKKYRYDAAGQLVWEEHDDGRTISYTYDAQGHVLTHTIDPEGMHLQTRYQYDAVGRQLFVTEPNGCIKQFSYDTQGNLVRSVIDANGLNLVTEFKYDDRGLLLRQEEHNPKGYDKVTEYKWDSLGRQIALIKDPDGLHLKTRYTYDANDNLTCITDPRGHSTHYTYDVLDRCHYEVDARGAVTEHFYSVNGNEVKTIHYAHRVSGLAEYTDGTLLAALQKDEVLDHYEFRMFDMLHRVLWSYDAAGYATRYEYDKNDNLIARYRYAQSVSIDALKKGGRPIPDSKDMRIERFIYDGLNQLRFEYKGVGSVIEYQYDASGHISMKTEYAHHLAVDKIGNYTLEYFQSHLRSDKAKDKTARYVYDKAGRLSFEVSPQGRAKFYQYNGLNQVISCTHYAQLLTPTMSLSELTPGADDRTTYYVYDAAGRERYRIGAQGLVVERTYDALGNVVAQITHAQRAHEGHHTLEELDALCAGDTKSRTVNYTYDALGRITDERNAKDISTHYMYDENNNVTSKTHANKIVWTYVYNEVNQQTEIHSPEVLVQGAQGLSTRSIKTVMDYDSFGNLIEETRDSEGLCQKRYYAYDAQHNRIKTTYPGVLVNNASGNASAQRHEVVRDLVEEVRYNAFAEVIATCDRAGNWKHFVYNSYGHLIYSVNTLGALTEHHYDPLGQLISTTRYATPVVLNEADYTLEAIGKARRITEHDRHEFYVYSLDNQLIEHSRDAVRTYNPRTRTYHITSPVARTYYNAFGEVTEQASLVQENQWAKKTFYYDKEGHQKASIDAEGYLSEYTYTVFGETERVTEYAQRVGSWDEQRYSAPATDSKDRHYTYEYDALGQMVCKTLKQVEVAYLDTQDKNKLKTKTQDLVTRYTYDALGNLVCTVDAHGYSAYCFYDNLGQLIAKIGPETQKGRAATTYTYDALGNLVQTNKWAQGVSEVDTEHYVLNAASARDVVTRSKWSIEGQLLEETDGMGHKIEYSYDANGNLARSFRVLTRINDSPLIQERRYIYDSEHHLVRTTTFKDGVNAHHEDACYTAFGEVCAKGFNGQYGIQVAYDRLGRVWRSNTQGYYQLFIYDLADNVTQVVMANSGHHASDGDEGIDISRSEYGLTEYNVYLNQDLWITRLQRQDNVYDASGHLLEQVREYNGFDRSQTRSDYLATVRQTQTVDRWGNMSAYTNALGAQTRYEYTALNEVSRQELPEVSVMDAHGVVRRLRPEHSYYYDSLGRVLGIRDGLGNVSRRDYDALGNIIVEYDAKNARRSKEYSLLGELVAATNERGVTITYAYDKNGRLTEIKKAGVGGRENAQYVYDEAGQLIEQTQGGLETRRFAYDGLGRQIKRSSGSGRETEYAYDDAGHKTLEHVIGQSRSMSWGYDAQGRLITHRDLGNHVMNYRYNTNGLLLEETSNTGKDVRYYYQGNGQVIQYVDKARQEVIDYGYDAEGQLISKESSSSEHGVNNGWVRETDYYAYDALGRLVTVRRRNPDDAVLGAPVDEKALLLVDYDYDLAGNIAHARVGARYPQRAQVVHDEYYAYDENNRLTVNKGQLINGAIQITSAQGSALAYDAAGNLTHAQTYEHGSIQDYVYEYTEENQLEMIRKNGHLVQRKKYDALGRVYEEKSYDSLGNIAQQNTMLFKDNGELYKQVSVDGSGRRVSTTTYGYDAEGNLGSLVLDLFGEHPSRITHTYSYEYWESALQKEDIAVHEARGATTTYGQSTRYYTAQDGLLYCSWDRMADGNGASHTNYYLNSALDGIRARKDGEGTTGYLTVGGKTIGDVQLSTNGTQKLTVYSGFTPVGSQKPAQADVMGMGYGTRLKIEDIRSSFTRAAGDTADGVLPDSPQDNLGSYTVQAGDTMETIALHVYGDSSLWYLIADANGVTDRRAVAGYSDSLHVGQRIMLPPAASGQHQTHATHKVLNMNELIGDTSATTSFPQPVPPKPKHHSFWSKVLTGLVTVFTTIVVAGALTAILGPAASALTSYLGSTLGSVVAHAAVGFASGFVGSLAGQTAAIGLKAQEHYDVKGALINGLGAAATAGAGSYFGEAGGLKDIRNGIAHLSQHSPYFNLSSAVEMMEQNAVSQGINVSLRRHQHFDWEGLGIAGLGGGVLGGKIGQSIDNQLNRIDHNSGILHTGFDTLAGAGMGAATSGYFDAAGVLSDSLGKSLGAHVLHTPQRSMVPDTQEINWFSDDIASEFLGTDYVPQHTAPATTRSENNVLLPAAKPLLYGSDALGYLGHVLYDDFDTGHFAGEGALAAGGARNIVPLRLDNDENYTYQESSYTFEEALNKQVNQKMDEDKPKYWTGNRPNPFSVASEEQVRKFIDVDSILSDPVKKMQFMDLHYEEGFQAKELDNMLKGAGRLDGTGAIFLSAAKENNIHPVYFVIHALLESSNGGSLLAKKNNFLGVSAYDGRAKAAGSSYAERHGWTTPEKGIRGAAEFISQRWINNVKKPQSTLYAMRWNPLNPAQMQYATDINWANVQAGKIYSALKQINKTRMLSDPKFIITAYYKGER